MPKDDLDELYAGHDESDEPGGARGLAGSKYGYTTCPECGRQSVKGANSTHPWCVLAAKLAGAPRSRATKETCDDVASITFEIAFKSGYARKAKFIRPEKTLDLLRDDGSLGDFLRGLLNGGD